MIRYSSTLIKFPLVLEPLPKCVLVNLFYSLFIYLISVKVYRATLKQTLLPPSYLGPRRTRKSPAGPLGPVIRQDPPPSVPTASVAIKILHPHVAKTISRDLSIMAFFARCISILPAMQWLSLPEEVQVFGKMMHQQLDLRNEADNLLAFENNFAPRKVPVTFPRPLKLWSTKDLLVEEYENALPLEAFLRNGGGPYDEQVATVGLDAFLVCLQHTLISTLTNGCRICSSSTTLFILIFTLAIS